MNFFFRVTVFMCAGLMFFRFTGFAQDNGDLSELNGVIRGSVEAYEKVTDYRTTFYKQEESGGKLGEKEKIFLKFEKPFKIYMHWLDTHKQGLQVLYERGKRDGKLAIHKPGLLLGLAPIIFLDQTSPWVREGSEAYNIEDAGIGTFLHDFSRAVEKGAREGKISVELSRDSLGRWADVWFPGSDSEDPDYFAYRVKVLFDASSQLPVQMSLYDWSENITGIYEYRDVLINIGTQDEEFKRIAQKQLYKLYTPAVLPPAKKNNFAVRR